MCLRSMFPPYWDQASSTVRGQLKRVVDMGLQKSSKPGRVVGHELV
jgi:hypothetical protein